MPGKKFVYVLFMVSEDHELNETERNVVGVYTSKKAAAEAAGRVETNYGDFDSAIEEEMFNEGTVIDNREDPPDDGCLLQFGSEEFGGGDYVRLEIEKFQLHGAGNK